MGLLAALERNGLSPLVPSIHLHRRCDLLCVCEMAAETSVACDALRDFPRARRILLRIQTYSRRSRFIPSRLHAPFGMEPSAKRLLGGCVCDLLSVRWKNGLANANGL